MKLLTVHKNEEQQEKLLTLIAELQTAIATENVEGMTVVIFFKDKTTSSHGVCIERLQQLGALTLMIHDTAKLS